MNRERADLVETLAKHRFFLRNTTRDLGDADARKRTTVSALHLGGLIKHVAATEKVWANFIVDGPSAFAAAGDWEALHTMFEHETLEELLAEYEKVAARTDELIATVDLDADQPLPPAPWFEAGARWSARRVLLHLIAETSQHAGHADIIRESLDGAKSMG
ncbi:DinB family protein [Longispora sp. K20-0274]|uniref:DinB family protein n=1 Tax=Longispora sp. K20-0274 TaxID=3088255 RepID=UPI00399A5B03